MREFAENREGVHLMVLEHTLCGDAIDIEAVESIESDGNPMPTSKRTVTCERCKVIIALCRGVRTA